MFNQMQSFNQTQSGKTLGHGIPIHDFPKAFQVIGAAVAVIDVISVLPHIASQKRGGVGGERGGGIAGGNQIK